MKNYLDNINEIPAQLSGTCFSDSKLCLFCRKDFEKYKKNPYFIWDKLPQECNFAGFIFLKREEIKQKIRKKKEKILSLKTKLCEAEGFKEKRILKDIEKYQKEIDVYKEFGSESW